MNKDEEKLELREIYTGINQFRHYVFKGTFGILDAQLASSKAAYLAAIIMTDFKGELKKFDPTIPVTEFMITHPDYNFLNKRLRFVARGEALFYWHKTISLLFPADN